MSASVVQICNIALLKFGSTTITELGPETKESRACQVFYPLMRDELIYSHPWNFAMARADISAQVAPVPAFGFDYAYTLPTDCLRVWELIGDSEWAVESGQLLTNQDTEIYIRYIRRVEESGRFTPSFVSCFGTYLGAELSAKLAGDKSMRQALLQELHEIQLPAAYSLNAMEGNRPKHKDEQSMDNGNYSWAKEGR